jgi:hypothetical protein
MNFWLYIASSQKKKGCKRGQKGEKKGQGADWKKKRRREERKERCAALAMAILCCELAICCQF